jgi:hypothetical protein
MPRRISCTTNHPNYIEFAFILFKMNVYGATPVMPHPYAKGNFYA